MHVDEGRPVILHLILRVKPLEKPSKLKEKIEALWKTIEEQAWDRTGIAFTYRGGLVTTSGFISVAITCEGIVSILLVDPLYPFRDPTKDLEKFTRNIINKIQEITQEKATILRKEVIDLGPNLSSWAQVTYPG